MPSKPLVSVIIPTHNSAQFIAETVQSALEQTHDALEIIVVDDGSTDDTVARLDRFGDRVRVHEQPNSGAAVARNRGLSMARGEYVAFLDADDLWHPRKLQTQLEHVRSCKGCRAVYGSWLKWEPDATGTWPAPSWPDAGTDAATLVAERSGWLYHQLLQESVIHTSAILFHRSVIDTVGAFDERLRKGQDLDYWLRVSRVTPVHKLETVLSLYRIHRSSITFRPVATNYRAEVIQKALDAYGLTDVTGAQLDRSVVDRVLATVWRGFGKQHLSGGSSQVAMDSFRRSIALHPTHPSTWPLLARAWFKARRSAP
jgi:glycosyltransferase involved in cell wall biosynthesis